MIIILNSSKSRFITTTSSGMSFDKIREKALAPKLLEMISKLIDRLNEINDGTYVMHDMITDYLKTLI